MLFKVINFFFPVVGSPPTPVPSRDDGTSTNKPPLVGGEDFATWGLPERARSHG
jgi:hypothetical protein